MNEVNRFFSFAAVIWMFILVGAALAAEEAPKLVIVKDGQPAATIVVADEPDAIISRVKAGGFSASLTTEYAAEQLQLYVEQVTGAKLPIVKASQAPDDQILILVGRSSLTKQRNITPEGLKPEGFIIRTDADSVTILGEIAPEGNWQAGIDRGTLWGVYEFLERVAGVRWYFPGELGTVIPAKKTLVVEPMTVVMAPAFQLRLGGGIGSGPEWLPVARPGNSTGFWANHTHGLPWAKAFGAEHPEYFALRPDGTRMMDPEDTSCHTNHLCYTEPGVVEQDLANIAQYDKTGKSVWMSSYTRPNAWYVKFCPQDSEKIFHCTCPRCRAKWRLNDPRGKLSEIIFGYAAALARGVAQRWPGRRVGANAYSGFETIPHTVEIPDNLDIMYCMLSGTTMQKEPWIWDVEHKVIDEWIELLGHDRKRFYIWEYFYYPNRFHEAPMYSPHVLFRFYREYQPFVMGVFNNGLSQKYGNKAKLTLLIGWLNHKALWNPGQRVDRLLSDFYDKMFGPAKQPMGKFFNLQISTWENSRWITRAPEDVYNCTKQQIYGETYTADVVDQLRAYLDEARAAAPEGSIYAQRVEFYAEAHADFFAEAAQFRKYGGPAPEFTAKRVQAPPVPNGVLDEASWQQPAPISLVKWEMGETPEAATNVWLAHDDERLFIAARLAEATPDQLVANAAERDDPAGTGDDLFGIQIDSGRGFPLGLPSYYEILVNSRGQILDSLKYEPIFWDGYHHSAECEAWDAEGLKAAAQVGWRPFPSGRSMCPTQSACRSFAPSALSPARRRYGGRRWRPATRTRPPASSPSGWTRPGAAPNYSVHGAL